MSKEVENYRQCTMIRRVSEGCTQQTTSWIPEVFAEPGAILKLRDKTGTWIDGWEVVSASPPMKAEIVEKNERNYLRQRKASDVVFKDIQDANRKASV